MKKKVFTEESVKKVFANTSFPYKAIRPLLEELEIPLMKLDIRTKHPELLRILDDKDLRGALYFSKDLLQYFILLHCEGMDGFETGYDLSIDEKEKFTVVHELGHYLKHNLHTSSKDETKEGIVFYRDYLASQSIDSDEKFANRFAAECLLPKELILKYLDSISLPFVTLPKDNAAIVMMARRFGVNPIVLKYRLENLWLLGK